MTYGDFGMFMKMVEILEHQNEPQRPNGADGAEQLRMMAAAHGG